MDEILAAAAEAAEFMKTRPYVRGQLRAQEALAGHCLSTAVRNKVIDAWYRDLDLTLLAIQTMRTGKLWDASKEVK